MGAEKKKQSSKKSSQTKKAPAKKSASKPAQKSGSSAKASAQTQTGKTGKTARRSYSRMSLAIMIVVFWGLSIITLFRLGPVGTVLYGVLNFLIGNFLYVFLLLGMWYGWSVIVHKGTDFLPPRIIAGITLLGFAWTSFFGLISLQSGLPWEQLTLLADNWLEVISGVRASSCGLAGAFLAGLSASLFSKAGAWIVVAAMASIGFGLLFYREIRNEFIRYQIYKDKKRSDAFARDAANLALSETEAMKSKSSHPSFLSDKKASYHSEAKQPVLQSSSKASFETSSLQIHEQRVKTRPFSFEKAAGLLDDQPEEIIREPVTLKSQSGAESDKSGTSVFDSLEIGFQSSKGKTQTSKAASSGLKNSKKQGKSRFIQPSIASFFKKEKPEKPKPVLFGSLDILDDLPAGNKAAENENIPNSAKLSEQSAGSDAPSAKKSSEKERDSDARIPKRSRKTGTAPQKPEESSVSAPLSHSRARSKPAEQPEMLSVLNLPAATSCDTSHYVMPKLSLLNEPEKNAAASINELHAKEDGVRLIEILNEFGVQADLSEIHIGPSVTKFEITPGTGVRVNSITNLQNDIKMALAATDIRIEAPIPGKSAVGIEVPNVQKTEVSMRQLLRAIPGRLNNLPLVFALGKDLQGDNVFGRLDTMPHLLIAGATGSGKSVCVNSIISSILMRTRPEEVKLILIDPKKVEFTPYEGVPHLLAPVITDGDLANKALQVVVAMMDRRYDLFKEAAVRNITTYNAYVEQNPELHLTKMPRMVVVIDELADLMLAAAKEVEQSIQRITQLARAAGIHLIVATQRPSVNVITGVIKANIPSRIAFAVSSTVDSRTILDQAGAERLLGYGDMLFLDNGDTAPRRIQGVFIKDEEVNRIAAYVKSQAAPLYDDAFITLKDLQSQGGTLIETDLDPLYEEIRHFVITSRKASTSLIQRRFSIGYSRAARVIDSLENNGVVGPAQGSRPREVLIDPPECNLE